jgi:hypothetical protein
MLYGTRRTGSKSIVAIESSSPESAAMEFATQLLTPTPFRATTIEVRDDSDNVTIVQLVAVKGEKWGVIGCSSLGEQPIRPQMR